ncbi:hypothetical protein SELMODRAFT_404359 [Selaginella moellendorffii]|uniref:Uncharacterized protein n=1 Tax=Selaginella moellendorffii TaxID=88036 RepID=D8QV31_SELML|nr:hypothetical protein SELMODRAFT_404359 [Selaginella moellendorffii]
MAGSEYAIWESTKEISKPLTFSIQTSPIECSSSPSLDSETATHKGCCQAFLTARLTIGHFASLKCFQVVLPKSEVLGTQELVDEARQGPDRGIQQAPGRTGPGQLGIESRFAYNLESLLHLDALKLLPGTALVAPDPRPGLGRGPVWPEELHSRNFSIGARHLANQAVDLLVMLISRVAASLLQADSLSPFSKTTVLQIMRSSPRLISLVANSPLPRPWLCLAHLHLDRANELGKLWNLRRLLSIAPSSKKFGEFLHSTAGVSTLPRELRCHGVSSIDAFFHPKDVAQELSRPLVALELDQSHCFSMDALDMGRIHGKSGAGGIDALLVSSQPEVALRRIGESEDTLPLVLMPFFLALGDAHGPYLRGAHTLESQELPLAKKRKNLHVGRIVEGEDRDRRRLAMVGSLAATLAPLGNLDRTSSSVAVLDGEKDLLAAGILQDRENLHATFDLDAVENPGLGAKSLLEASNPDRHKLGNRCGGNAIRTWWIFIDAIIASGPTDQKPRRTQCLRGQ